MRRKREGTVGTGAARRTGDTANLQKAAGRLALHPLSRPRVLAPRRLPSAAASSPCHLT